MKKLVLSLLSAAITFSLGFAQAPTNGLIAYFPFNGNANDESGIGYNGSVNNAVLTADRFGNANKAYEFNGTSSSITTNLSLLNNFSGLTATGWIYPESLGVRIGFFGQNDLFEFGFLDTANMDAWLDRIGKGVLVSTSGMVSGWHMVTAVADSDSLWFYVDGIMKKSTPTSAASFGSTKYYFNIGGGGIFDPTGNFFLGAIDDIRIYNRALTRAEIDTLFHEGGWHLSSTVVKSAMSTVPDNFVLYQSYPNPFNPSTTIRFDIPEQSPIRLTIFNILGQEVAELANEIAGPGSFTKSWNANAPSGIYFYQITVLPASNSNKKYTDTKKMLLLK